MSDPVTAWRARAPGSVLLEGFHAVKHAVRFGAEVAPIVTTSRDKALRLAGSHAGDLLDVLAERLAEVDRCTFDTLVGRAHPTGVAALADRPRWTERIEPRRTAPVVVLDNPRNLGNFGAVIRVAAGLGAAGVYSTGDVDPWHPNVLRGSAGLHFAVPVARLDPVADLPGPVLGLDPDGVDIRGAVIPPDAVLCFGSERHGLTEELRARADRLLALPMRPGVSSYNLTTSVAMALYQATACQG